MRVSYIAHIILINLRHLFFHWIVRGRKPLVVVVVVVLPLQRIKSVVINHATEVGAVMVVWVIL